MDPNSEDFRAPLPPIQRQRQQVQDQGTAQTLNRLRFPVGSNSQLHQRLLNPHPSALSGIDRERDLGMAYLHDQLNYRQELELRQRVMNEHDKIVVDLLAAHQANDLPPSALQHQQTLNLQNSGGRIFLSDEQLRLRAAAQQQQQLDILRQQRQMQKFMRPRQTNSSPPLQMRKRSSSTVSNTSRKDCNATIGKKKLKKRSDAKRSANENIAFSEEKNALNFDEPDLETKVVGTIKKILPEHSIDLTCDEDSSRLGPCEEQSDSDSVDHGIKESADTFTKVKNTGEECDATTSNSVKKLTLLLQAAKDSKVDSVSLEPQEHSTLENVEGTPVDTSTELQTKTRKEDSDYNVVTFSDEDAVVIVNNLKHVPANPLDISNNTEQDEDREELFPGFVAILPMLPVEPNFSEEDQLEGIEGLTNRNDSLTDEHISADVPPTEAPIGPIFLQPPKRKTESKNTNSLGDTWWPSNSSIRRERRWQGYESEIENQDSKVEQDAMETSINGSISISSSMHEKLRNHIEPGVLEKLPHCKAHEKIHQTQYGRKPSDSLFCCQATETYCNSVMVCCSICSTWRHVECGGHYERYSIKSTQEEFIPICDRCHVEKALLKKYPIAVNRMNRQHMELVRRAEATSAIMRQLAYAKHGGTYKWPLGSVSSTHIGGHTRSVHLRHERSEKQWGDMARILSSPPGLRTRDKTKARTKELERLAVNLEDAEGHTDRHNMILFLQNDTMKEYPVGFEKPHQNFFDPEEDEQLFIENSVVRNAEKTVSYVDKSGREFLKNENVQQNLKRNEAPDEEDSELEQTYLSGTDDDTSCIPRLDDDQSSSSQTSNYDSDDQKEEKGDLEQSNHKKQRTHSNDFPVCARPCCKRSPRFDSAFCSDGCGVSTLELDVLRSLQYANEIHPYQLRL